MCCVKDMPPGDGDNDDLWDLWWLMVVVVLADPVCCADIIDSVTCTVQYM